jgi:hypothetical protein
MSMGSELRDEQSALALERLSPGLNLTADAVILMGLCSFFFDAAGYPHLAFSIAAWVLLVITALFTQLPALASVRRSALAYPAVLAICAVIVALDIVGCWSADAVGLNPAAVIGVGGVLLTCASTQRARAVLVPTGVLCAVLVAVFVSTLGDDPLALGPRAIVVLLAVLPPIVGVRIVRSFRLLVHLEADRAQVQATVSAPGNAVGMLASKELARLDLDAERLLDAVATGSAPLPLDSKSAKAAASIATELRLHLIAGRDKTWLYHAVSESAVLGPVVTVTDSLGLAARLSTAQRDSLLTAIWLFAGDLTRTMQSLRIDLAHAGDESDGRRIAIGFHATGVPRKQVDPAVWQAIGKVGRFTESNRGTTLRVDIDCLLERPTDR